MSITIQPATAADTEAIARIYNHYILSSVTTFEESALSEDEVAARIKRVTSASLPWLVAKDEGEVVGYCYARPWHERAAYRFSVETSLYVAPAAMGRGVGTQLYDSLLKDLRAKGMHTAIGGISLPNPASVALHERFGFEKVAHYREVGFKFGQWIDVGYWQVSLGA